MTAAAQVLTGRIATSAYGWERATGTGDTTQLRVNGNVQTTYAARNFSLGASFQASTDLAAPLAGDPRFRLFHIMVDRKNIGGVVDLRVGRQTVFGGVNYGTIDGVHVRLHPAKFVETILYAGGITPPSQEPHFFRRLGENWQIGGHSSWSITRGCRVGLSYMNRHRETTPFTAYCHDAQLGVVPTLVDYGSRANQYGSLDILYTRGGMWLFGRTDYDFNFRRVCRAELDASYRIDPDLEFVVSLSRREPMIAWNSYFAMFETTPTGEAAAGADYRLNRRLTLHGRVSLTAAGDETVCRATLGASCDYASIMYTKDAGGEGDLDGFNLQACVPLLGGGLVPHLGAVYSAYALADDLARTRAWAAVAGATLRPSSVLTVDFQGQFMANRIYASDIRAFGRIEYRFSHFFRDNTGKEGR
ncbi:MAG: hypothetical protein QHI48_10745 [Bacteroidota bacterium]|nr:hypothetical protein [Bacteroidota bacterium]